MSYLHQEMVVNANAALAQKYRYNSFHSSILMLLAFRINENGICWPGIQRIAAETTISRRQVQKVLRELERDRVVLSSRRPDQTTQYALNVRLIQKVYASWKAAQPTSPKRGVSQVWMGVEEVITITSEARGGRIGGTEAIPEKRPNQKPGPKPGPSEKPTNQPQDDRLDTTGWSPVGDEDHDEDEDEDNDNDNHSTSSPAACFAQQQERPIPDPAPSRDADRADEIVSLVAGRLCPEGKVPKSTAVQKWREAAYEFIEEGHNVQSVTELLDFCEGSSFWKTKLSGATYPLSYLFKSRNTIASQLLTQQKSQPLSGGTTPPSRTRVVRF